MNQPKPSTLRLPTKHSKIINSIDIIDDAVITSIFFIYFIKIS